MRSIWHKRARTSALILAGAVGLYEAILHPSLGTFAYFVAALAALALLFRLLPALPAGPPVSCLLKPSALLLSLLVALALGEGILRVFFARDFWRMSDEKNLCYRYNATLGWFPIPNSTRTITASRTITVHNNSKGFRGPEHIISAKPGIMVLGDSFVWGYDVEEPERFTEKLQARHTEWAVYNLGVSGYGTDQEYLLLQKYFATYRPKVVLLVFCVENDRLDNSSNAGTATTNPISSSRAITSNSRAFRSRGMSGPLPPSTRGSGIRICFACSCGPGSSWSAPLVQCTRTLPP